MPRYNFRVVMPRLTEPVALLKLSNAVYDKHVADGPASPLKGEVADKWAVVGPKLAGASTKQARIEALEKELETLYQDRDLVLTDAEPVVKQSRDLLIGYYGVPKVRNLGDHGFEVNDTPNPPKPPKPPKNK